LAKFAAEAGVVANGDHQRGIPISQAMPRRFFQARSDGGGCRHPRTLRSLVSRNSLFCWRLNSPN